MHPLHLLVPLSLILSCSHQGAQKESTETTKSPTSYIGGPCECCEAVHEDRPDFLGYETVIAGPEEPGERLFISGRILHADGTPAEGVILYVYHTNSEGIYAAAEGQTGCARRHGRLRGWMQTDAKGQYAFHTILPGSYPNSTQEKHIHPVILEPGKNEYWIDEFVFDNDPLLTDAVRKRARKRGGSGIVKLKRDSQGVWFGSRDIVLGKNVDGY